MNNMPENPDDLEEKAEYLATKTDGSQIARVMVTLAMNRNLGNYETARFSVTYEQFCRPEEKESMTSELEMLATRWITKRNRAVDDYLRREEQQKNKP